MPDDVSQRFNVDLTFLYGSVWSSYQESVGSYDERGRGARALVRSNVLVDGRQPSRVKVRQKQIDDHRQPDFEGARTDWNRRVTSLPTIRKRLENWTGKTEVSEVTFELADTDGAVYGSIFAGSVHPFGTTVAIYTKVSENPDYWMGAFSGEVTGYSRSAGLTSLTIEDHARNLWNSGFVSDYSGIATHIDGKTYGTIEDIVGTNLYITDRGDQHLIVRRVDSEDSGWMGMALGALVGAGFALIGGGGALAAAIGGISGGISMLPESRREQTQYYYKINDYNAIPDGMIFGGQKLKFHSATVNGNADGANGALYERVAHRVRGGTFQYGLYGTVEVDDLLEDAKIGDYIYAELPLIFFGSPDDILANMLTGSNASVRFTWPDDFAEDWFVQTSPLRHIELYAQMDDFEEGGVMEAIDSLAQEVGFSFFLDSENKFACRTLRELDLTSTNIIGTLSEEYNILGAGLKRTNSLREVYTDIEFKYRDQFSNMYDKTFTFQTNAATWMGGRRRIKTINSKWVHDLTTAEFLATRLARRYATSVAEIEGEVSLYSVPVELGEIVDVTGWAVGTNQKYEITEFQKDFGRGITRFKAIDAEPMYAFRSYGYVGTDAGFATVLADLYDYFGSWGEGKDPLSPSRNSMSLYFSKYGSLQARTLVGSYIKFDDGTDEIVLVTGVEPRATALALTEYIVYDCDVERGQFDTLAEWHMDFTVAPSVAPFSTCFNIPTGTTCKWY